MDLRAPGYGLNLEDVAAGRGSRMGHGGTVQRGLGRLWRTGGEKREGRVGSHSLPSKEGKGKRKWNETEQKGSKHKEVA